MTISSYFRFDDIESQLGEAPEGRVKLFSDATFKSMLEKRLNEMLDGDRILSLDIFDTLALRDNSSEITRFYEIGGQMAEVVEADTGQAIDQVDAFVARYLGMKATYRASKSVHNDREGSLCELHNTASRLLTGGETQTEAFIGAEISYEATRIQMNPFLTPFVAKYRAAGGKVVLVTDMYMHADQVGDLLKLLRFPPEEYDFLISSADTKVSKATGGIFPLVEKALAAGPEKFVHLGDSFRGDVAQPLRRGWQALHLPLSNFDIQERRRDHLEMQNKLAAEYALTIDISMPR
jgi:predicted HAD superfamily hydrolase